MRTRVRAMLGLVGLVATAVVSIPTTALGGVGPVCAPVPDGKVGWWTGESTAGVAFDQVHGNNGSLVGDASSVPGKVGNAFNLDGDGDYIDIPHSDNYNGMSDSMTVEAWVRVDEFQSDHDTFVSKGDSSWRLQRFPNSESARFGSTHAGNPDPFPHDQNGDIDILGDNPTWHHLAAVYDGTTKYLYVDGVLDISSSDIPEITNNFFSVRIGDNSEQPGRYFDGLIDEVTLYRTALTEAQIDGIVAADNAGKCRTLPSTIVVNSTGDGSDTTLEGGICSTGAVVGDEPACSLRAAIQNSNASDPTELINFNIPGDGPHTISPTTDLPTITDITEIAGDTEPGTILPSANPGVPMIYLDGTTRGAGGNGLTLAASGTDVRSVGIVDWNGYGLLLQSTNHGVTASYIGTNPADDDLGNGTGIRIEGSSATIGGQEAHERNVISGNGGTGVEVLSGSNTISGNLIGTDNEGGSTDDMSENPLPYDLGNGGHGVNIGTGNGNTISNNVISNNEGYGVRVLTDNNEINGNLVGITADGADPLGNSFDGVALIGDAVGNDIGGSGVGERNVISANTGHGVYLSGGSFTHSNEIAGNYIGTDITGEIDRGNVVTGIRVDGAQNNVFGGPQPADGNLISGNSGGIHVRDAGSSGNSILNNYIGTDKDGVSDIGNNNSGVSIDDGATTTTVGQPGDTNLIAFNAEGVQIGSLAGSGHSVRGNSIRSNDGLGIDLNPAGVTPNDDDDLDGGPNGTQNFPVLTTAIANEGTSIEGDLNSTPETTFDVDFYSSPDCDASQNGEGAAYIGSTQVVTDDQGNGTVSVTVSPTVQVGDVVTSTATAPNGNTSEFSGCEELEAPDLSLTKSAAAGDYETTDTLTYTIDVANAGPGGATDVIVTDNLPDEVSYESATPTSGTCEENNNVVSCNLGSLGVSDSDSVTIEVTIDDAGLIQNGASVSSFQNASDPQENNSDDADVSAALAPQCRDGQDNDGDGETDGDDTFCVNEDDVVEGGVAARCGTPDVICGTGGNNVLTGTAGPDTIFGGGGNDTCNGLGGNDDIFCGGGNDTINGGGGFDQLYGANGKDGIKGGAGHDEMFGAKGNDNLNGGEGPDELNGGPGADKLNGGPGNDTCVSDRKDTKMSC
jgi:uncharacterized repeat protein (TIGR01451 family)